MNYFTKEELQIIQWEINTAVNKLEMATLPCEKYLELNEKIKFLIDNYCEHDFIPCLGTSYLEICSKPDCMVLR